MRTVKVEALFLHPDYEPNSKDMSKLLNGKCPNCSIAGGVSLHTSDEWTDFYGCDHCGLKVHADVIAIYVSEEVPKTKDAILGFINMLEGKGDD
ncbi:MAG: hypothetical protein KAQ85_00905 [Thermodesulfovibrionia bacterium]|nr:hypothetical protein [Thermodesulfovibrionia bacterium]